MSKVVKINSQLLNKSEIARRLGYSPQYIGQILSGKKPGIKVKDKIISIIKNELKAA